jgi:hypothetical protein
MSDATRVAEATFVYRIDANDIVIFVDHNWLAFAQENDARFLIDPAGWHQSLWKFITGLETRYLYRMMIEKVRTTGKVMSIPFRCDSPGRRRFMEMHIVPLPEHQVEFRSHILRQERRASVRLLDGSRVRSSDLITMCSWCKRVKVPPESWEEVEEAVKDLDLFGASRLPQITHGMCPLCHDFYRTEWLN